MLYVCVEVICIEKVRGSAAPEFTALLSVHPPASSLPPFPPLCLLFLLFSSSQPPLCLLFLLAASSLPPLCLRFLLSSSSFPPLSLLSASFSSSLPPVRLYLTGVAVYT